MGSGDLMDEWTDEWMEGWIEMDGNEAPLSTNEEEFESG